MLRGGWAGSVLRVDLNREKTATLPLREELAKNFIGGRGFTSKLLYDEVSPRTDPLGPENKIFMAVGPCNGTLVPGSTRITIAAKSPLTGFIGDSNSGGAMGAELKYAGYDAVIIQGKAKKPLYLWIDDDDVQLRNAEYLWGKTTGETRRAIWREIADPEVEIASIGPAGENLVKFAHILSGIGRSHGRCGMGAVMGSKKLKAIAVRGTKGVKVADPVALQNVIQEMYELYHTDARTRMTMIYGGTPVIVPYNKLGVLPTRNYQTGVFKGVKNISSKNIKKLFSVAYRGCFSCPIAGMQYYVIGQEPYKGTYTEGIQAESLELYGSRLGNSNSNSVIKMHQVSDELGMDIADTSGMIGWALECFERGILTTKETGGLELDWGDYKTFIKLMEMIAQRKGFGNILAEGPKGAPQIIGRGSEKYMMHVKGLTIDTRDPRAFRGWALGYAVAARGAEHCRANFAEEGLGVTPQDIAYNLLMEGKAERIAWYENIRAIQNALEICEFCVRSKKMIEPQIHVRLYNAVTGSNIGENDLLMIGERINNIERAFNVREGLTRKDDTLPERFQKEPLPEGPAKGQVAILEPLINRYYKVRGWEKETGFPRKTKLMVLGLKDVADELESLVKLA